MLNARQVLNKKMFFQKKFTVFKYYKIIKCLWYLSNSVMQSIFFKFYLFKFILIGWGEFYHYGDQKNAIAN
jgi:hypothetical protein